LIFRIDFGNIAPEERMRAMFQVWHLWVIAGLALWIIEIFTSGFVIGVFGTACLIAAPFALAGASFTSQLLAFGIATLILFFAIRPFVVKHLYHAEHKARTNVDALIGAIGLVVDPVDHFAGTGSIKIGGEIWSAISLSENDIETGTKVIVRGIEGCKVRIEPAP
jgi:membrane protein implicated in regulation of membrane protease activity